jgi:hypothetical protein
MPVGWIEARIRELLEKHPNSDAHGTIRVGIRDPLETALDCPQWSPLSGLGAIFVRLDSENTSQRCPGKHPRWPQMLQASGIRSEKIHPL